MTRDLVETIERKLQIPLAPYQRRELRRMENEFLKFFFGYFEGIARTRSILATDICAKIETMIENQPYPVVSLDRIYAPVTDYAIEATRVTDPIGMKSTIGPRQGCLPIEQQIAMLKTNGPVSVADCGAFEGGTIEMICEMIERRRIRVDRVYLGVCGKRAKDRLSPRWKIESAYRIDLYEWIELRDAFLIDGRATYAPGREREFIPYSDNLQGWASVPEKKGKEAALLCETYNRKLIDLLSETNPIDQILARIGQKIRLRGDRR